ncbi:universal stress protein [Spongiivirga citrea]|uniref:Universal stress protein n=1 Tax=Spongiivirga citrea TaxID=1481457 RepID=A0A6M0CSK1_9FLAO|nr:universal stress protein [Spongiivirga citrea]NER16830.1 universal stress protein [Spongiivirga citrea]
MKRILLPTDFSENAYNAISYAVQLYRDVECEFYLMHTFTPSTSSAHAGGLFDAYSALKLQEIEQATAKRQLKKIEARLQKDYPNANHSYFSIASFNLLVSEMKNLISEKDIDVVIMGTKGATGAKEIFIGTNTMYAIKKLKCPVIAVPSDFKYETPKEILFPTDYKLNKSNKYLPLLRSFCDEHNSRLHILNAYYSVPLDEKQEEVKAFLDDFFTGSAHLFHIAEGQDLIEAIEAFETKHKVNFLVMIHNKHNLFENILFRPIINQMVYHTNVPFLVIPSVERMK